ncbi:MAG: hypothetical protein SPF20_02985 [Prevotella sp.]|nr:hypothetical protein [Prevotella sp.]
MIYTSKKIIIFLFTIMQLAILASCMDSGYRLSFPEIDDLADEYPAQAKVFLSRADSNDDKGYYKLLTAKIEYQLKGYIYKENDIDDAINIFVNEKDEPLLARSLYYKGASILNNYRDTAKAINWFSQAIAYDSNMREKEKLDMYDILCRITHQNIYTVELEDEARQTNNIRYRAWALLYRGINNQDQELANQAFEIANQIKESKDSTLGPMYYHYFQALMDRGDVPDSILISYAKKAQDNHGVKYDNNIDFYRLLTRNSKETHAFAMQHIKEKYSMNQELIKPWGYYPFALGYKYYLPLYFLSLQKGDTLIANRVAHELRQEAPLLAKDENSGKENQVKLMYEGGNTRYRYEKVKTYIFVGIIIVLIILLTMTYLSISRIRKAHQTIKNLHESLHQLKDVENSSLSEQCERLNHEITTQLRKLKRRDKDIEEYKAQITELTDISQGLVYYSMTIQNQNISQIGKQGIRQLLASFKVIDETYNKRLENYDLNPSQSLFCILYHIGKSDEEVMQILQYSLSNIRVRKSRIKSDTGAESFDDIIR